MKRLRFAAVAALLCLPGLAQAQRLETGTSLVAALEIDEETVATDTPELHVAVSDVDDDGRGVVHVVAFLADGVHRIEIGRASLYNGPIGRTGPNALLVFPVEDRLAILETLGRGDGAARRWAAHVALDGGTPETRVFVEYVTLVVGR